MDLVADANAFFAALIKSGETEVQVSSPNAESTGNTNSD
jgi:hypothetical protein